MLGFIALASMLFFKLDVSKANEFELSDKVIPIEYDLIITPNLDDGTYTGTVHIIVNVTKFQNSITLHSKDLEIIEARINHIKVDISFVTEYDFLRLLPYKPVLEGTNLIKISFNGDMKDKTNGFYRAYEATDKEDKYFATTFFQPINARVAFPCFDQPNFKARFSISLAKPHGYVALSNSNNIAETRVTNGYTYIRFAKTPPIPTHMVSLFIGDYEFTEDVYVKQNEEIIPVRIYASPVTVQKFNSLVQEIPLMLSWYANYTGFDYMLPELNYVAYFPKYDIYGRMENWGHLIENTNNPIFYNDMTSKLCKNFTLNVFHQVGHLWFEQLVTSSSWGEFWLTEGFVRFMDQKVADTYKDCDQTLLLQTTIFNNALWGDDIITAKPLNQEIKKPDDVYNILNYITYEKGCSVLMMLEKLIGEELMQKIIQFYIKKYQYQSVNSQEFVASVQSFVNVDISDFLDDFITQSGYPLITVELSENKSQVILLQEQCLTLIKWTVIGNRFCGDIDVSYYKRPKNEAALL